MFAGRVVYKDTPGREAGVFIRREATFKLFLRRFARNKLALLGALILIVEIGAALFGPLLTPYDPYQMQLESMLQPESPAHLMGTDANGRDLLTRLLYGARYSLQVSFLGVALGMVLGVPIGMMSGYYRGFWDEVVVMRLVDALQAFPFLILALALLAALGTGLASILIALGVGFMPGFLRISRAQTLAIANQDYIVAARALGMRDSRILIRHIFPNTLATLVVQLTLAMASAILVEAALSFLGLGSDISWGQLLNNAQMNLSSAPWLAYWPGLAIFVSILGFNLCGDGLRDALDPRTRD